MHYLCYYLKNEANSIVESLDNTWELFKQIFDKKRSIITKHIKVIIELKNVSLDSPEELKLLIN